MAKASGELAGTIKSKRPRQGSKIFFKRGKDGSLIIQSTPKPHQQSPLERLWVSNFTCLAQFTKAPWGGDYNRAQELQDQTGWYWRDVIHSALSGKLLGDPGKRVTTPTARVKRSGFEALTNGVLKALTPNDKDWDNSFFWDPVTNPSRLTVRNAGVYLVGCQLEFNAVSGGRRVAILRVNGTTVAGDQSIGAVASNLVRVDPCTLWAFNAGDYIEACGFANTTGVQVELENFWILAITPEAVTP